MAEREATIASRVGLHARPAAIFAEAAGDLPVEVTIAAKGEPPMRLWMQHPSCP